MELLSFRAMVIASILNFFMPVSIMIDAACDHYQNMLIGKTYYINNTEYPDKYISETACRWMAESAPGTRIVISCENVDLPATENCKVDRLSISLSGDENFKDSKNYCGKGSVSLVSNSNRMTVGLFAPTGTKQGRFLCTMTVILDQPHESNSASVPNVCDCGWQQATRIVGGVETKVNEFPSMAGLVNLDLELVYCGGSIISEKYVLTAGHCVWKKPASSLAILVGDHNTSSGADTSYSRLYVISAYEIHPNYNNSAQIFDVALIQTKLPIQFNLYVGPICLPFRYSIWDFAGQLVTSLGWGQKEFSGALSDVLRKIDVQVITNQQCYERNRNVPVLANQICTYTPGKDACQGDSGGPVLWMDKGQMRFHVVGVISVGLGCASKYPGINSRVTSFLSWIVSRTPDANYCIK